MSYAVKRVQKFAASPNHPQTATVYDFACLFTHDLKRKAKRWQDGKLKYHTFNKKVMVYDDRGHFVGDAHWDGDEDVAEGDELELDRGGVMVQVADCKGEREQDLTQVLDKRAREVEKRRQQAAAKAPRQSTNSAAGPAARQQHLPLSGLLQSPGPIGRAAIPDRSPFEARRQVLSHIGEPQETPQKSSAPPAKKRRLSPSPPSKAGFAQSLFGTKLSLSATPSAELLAARARALRERTNLQQNRELEAQQQATRPAIKKSVLKGFQPSTLRAIGMSAEQPVEVEEESESEEEPERTSHYFGERPKPKLRMRDVPSNERRGIIAKPSNTRDVSRQREQDSQPATSSPRQSSSTTRLERLLPTKPILPSKRDASFDSRDTTLSPPRQKIRKKQPSRSPSPLPKSTKSKQRPIPVASRSPSPTRSPPPPPKTKMSRQRSEVSESDSGMQARKEAKEKKRAAKAEAREQSQNYQSEEVCEKERPSRNEPRTELRIRARKRRGLLMMSDTLPPQPPRQLSPETLPSRRAESPELNSRDLSPPSPRRKQKRVSPEMALDLELEPEPARQPSEKLEELPVQSSPAPPSPVPRPVTTFKEPEVEIPSSPIIGVIPSSPHINGAKSANPTFDQLEDSHDIYSASIPSTAPQPVPENELPAAEPPIDERGSPQDLYNASIPSTMPEKEANTPTPSPVVDTTAPAVLLDSSSTKSEVPAPKVAETPGSELSEAPPTATPAAEPISEAEDDSPRPKRRNMRRIASKPYNIELEDEDEQPAEETDPQVEESEQIEPPSPPPPAAQGPRIARMARKSVKSREIFGFVPEALPGIMPMQFAKATIQLGNWKDVKIETEPKAVDTTSAVIEPEQTPTNETGAEVRAEPHTKTLAVPREVLNNENEMEESQVIKSAARTIVVAAEKKIAGNVPLPTSNVGKDDVSPELTAVNGTSRPRIVNPATRGKKAARKEDAAGKVLQTFVPFEPPRFIPRIAVKPQPESRRTEKPSVALPNFVAASGGAWSIHAHDLLGIARPSRQRK